MIYLIVGDNIYKRRQALVKIIGDTGLEPERYDGADLTENELADCIAGGTLFSSERLVVINELSANKPLWDRLSEWLHRVSAETTLVLIEPKPDRRTKAYKALSKGSSVIIADSWTDRQTGEAVRWISALAKQEGVVLASAQAQEIVNRALIAADRPGVYMIDQQVLANTVDALSLAGEVTSDSIDAVLPASNIDNVFELLDAALGSNTARTQELLGNLHATADPYMTLGFVMSQWAQLVALKVSRESPEALASRIGASPFVIKKLQRHADNLSLERIKQLTDLLARLDVQSKTTGADPWNLLARFIGELRK